MCPLILSLLEDIISPLAFISLSAIGRCLRRCSYKAVILPCFVLASSYSDSPLTSISSNHQPACCFSFIVSFQVLSMYLLLNCKPHILPVWYLTQSLYVDCVMYSIVFS